MQKLKLISAHISSNYVESGDRLFLTVKMQNVGDSPLDRTARFAADISFIGRHRREQDQLTDLRFTWEPMPSLDVFKAGEVWSTTGALTLPSTWGASFDLKLSIVDDKGETITFIGEDGLECYSQLISEIDLGWGWGRARLVEQRKPVFKEFNKPENVVKTSKPVIEFNGFKLGADAPQLLGYKDQPWLDVSPKLTYRNYETNESVTLPLEKLNCRLISVDGQEVSYLVEALNVAAEVFLKKDNEKFLLGVRNVKQNAPYELINIEFPIIGQSSAADTFMTNFFGGGRLLYLKDALPQSIPFIFDTCNTFAVGNKELCFCGNATDADSIMIQSVLRDETDKNYGVIGTKLVVNHPADKKGLLSIPVDTVPVEIHVITNASWKSSALVLQKSLPESKKYYQHVAITKIMCDASAQYNPENPATYASRKINTFKEIESYADYLSTITDGAKQLIYMVGWQKGGHDFEYPYPYKSGINPKVGTLEEYLNMQKRLKDEKNVILSFHDNFDDAYLSENYDLDEEIVAYDERGQQHKGWLWAGGMSYIVSPCKYIKSKALDERIEKTVEMLNLKEIGTYHLDVMTSENRRYDFSKRTSAQKNFLAKLEIVKRFNKLGVDITSETLAMPYLGHLSYGNGVRLRKTGELFKGDTFVPLTTLAMHGVIATACSYGSDEDMLFDMVYGYSNAFATVSGEELIYDTLKLQEKYFLYSLPMLKLSYIKPTDIEYSKEKACVSYGDNSYVKVDFKEKSYEIVLDGKKIAWDFNTLDCNNGNYYFYSRKGGSFNLSFPADWEKARVSKITEQGRTESIVIYLNNLGF